MKFQLGEKVSFKFGNKMLIGTIDIRDFGGSIEHDYHSYNIFLSKKKTCYTNTFQSVMFSNFHIRKISTRTMDTINGVTEIKGVFHI